jgi:hypothetical protein
MSRRTNQPEATFSRNISYAKMYNPRREESVYVDLESPLAAMPLQFYSEGYLERDKSDYF